MNPPPVQVDPKDQQLVDAAWRVEQAATEALTDRELDVLGLVVAGATTPQIAAQLELSQSTVKGYLHGLYAKTGLPGREPLVRLAFDLPAFAPAPVAPPADPVCAKCGGSGFAVTFVGCKGPRGIPCAECPKSSAAALVLGGPA